MGPLMCSLSLLREVSRGVYSLRIWVSLGLQGALEGIIYMYLCIRSIPPIVMAP